MATKTSTDSQPVESSSLATTPTPPPATPSVPLTREQQAMAIVKGYLGWSAGAGLLPVPVADVVLITAIQLRMLAKLAKLYDVPFKRNAAKSIVASLLGSVLPASVAGGLSSALKAAPGVGTILGIATLPALATASTYAIGKVFITHFEAGGTFLTFDPEKVRAYFASEFNKAQNKTDNPAAP